jgi:phospholipase D1/2
MDFQNVSSWQDNELSKADYGRMPWHDVAMCIQGGLASDIKLQNTKPQDKNINF